MIDQPSSSTDNGHSAGAPADAVGAFEAALIAAAKATPADTAVPTVSLAFALGWQMAELSCAVLRQPAERGASDPPGVGALSEEDCRQISVDQVQAALTKLAPAIQTGGLTVPTNELDALRTALGNWQSAGPSSVAALHHKLLGTLTAADLRLGKAYGLGRALADTCRASAGASTVNDQLDPRTVANLLASLDDLSTALPPHAAHSVYTSLSQWRQRAAAHQLPTDATSTITRQGEVWRALLSGEKRGTETLEIGNYLQAAGKVLRHMSSIVGKALLHFWWLSLLVVVLLVGSVVLFVAGGGPDIVAGAGTLVAAFGLTWKGLGGILGKLAGKLEQPLWGAVLDAAIADAITLQPDNQADVLGRAKLAFDLAAGSEPARPTPGSADSTRTSVHPAP